MHSHLVPHNGVKDVPAAMSTAGVLGAMIREVTARLRILAVVAQIGLVLLPLPYALQAFTSTLPVIAVMPLPAKHHKQPSRLSQPAHQLQHQNQQNNPPTFVKQTVIIVPKETPAEYKPSIPVLMIRAEEIQKGLCAKPVELIFAVMLL